MAGGVTFVDRLVLDIQARFDNNRFGRFDEALQVANNTYSKLENRLKSVKRFEKLGLTFNKHGDIIDAVSKKFVSHNDVMKRMEIQAKKTGRSFANAMRSIQGPLLGVGFGLLFIGMAIKQFSQQILTSLVTAFTAARDEGDFLSNKILGVSAAFEFLKFSIFDAFANSDIFIPLIDFIINLTNAVSQFIAKNPGLATFLVIMAGIGVVAGGLMMFFGQIALSVLALISAFELFAPIIMPILSALLSVGLVPILTIIGIIIAIVVLLVAAWQTNFASIKEFTSAIFGGIWETIKSVMGNIFGIFSGVFKILKGVMTGDFELIWEGLVNIVLEAVAAIVKILFGLGTTVFNIFLFVVNGIKDLFINIIKIVIGAIKGLVEIANRVPGVNISTSGFDKSLNSFEAFKVGTQIKPFEAEQTKLQLEAIEELKNIATDFLTGQDKEPQVVVNVEGNVLGEEDMLNRVLKNISDNQLGSTNGG